MSDALFQVMYPSLYEERRLDALAKATMPPHIQNLLDRADEVIKQSKLNRMTGIEKIAQERLEQKTKGNFTLKSDWEQYPDFELATLAGALLGDITDAPDCFPDKLVKKLGSKSYEEKLIIAGALIAAEIDRLNFKE